jgi:hypothetical protein
MERTVPTTGSEEIELYIRTYYSLLRTTDEVHLLLAALACLYSTGALGRDGPVGACLCPAGLP